MNTKEWDEAVTEGTLKIIERMFSACATGAGARYRGGGKRIVYSHYSQFREWLSEYMYSCIIRVFRS